MLCRHNTCEQQQFSKVGIRSRQRAPDASANDARAADADVGADSARRARAEIAARAPRVGRASRAGRRADSARVLAERLLRRWAAAAAAARAAVGRLLQLRLAWLASASAHRPVCAAARLRRAAQRS